MQSQCFQALLESNLSILLLWHLSPLMVSAFLLCLFSKAASAGIPQVIVKNVKEFDGNAQVCVTPNGWIDDNSFV